nr:MAG TPA: L SHAPED TAIL FIBER PROTEIN [Caudoviricetes sp.]
MATLETTNISNEIKVINDLSYYNEQLALKHATDAENSANKAKSEADKASASAGDVESSANRAKSEADKASASAAEAKSILNSAVTTITNTKNSAISAIQAEGNTQRTSLQGYVDSAKSYANSASASASTATTKASEIVTSANNTKTYMTNAQSYMNTAKTYQDNALSYKNSAQTSASVATEQANLAKQYASSVDKESINISKMYTTGAVSTDTQGYNQLVEMKRSTFDKSKFTVVGSPTITDDGVASGFKKGNDLNFPAITVTDNSIIVIRTKIKTVPRASSSDTNGQCIFGFYKNDTSEYIDTYNLWNGANITLGYKHKGVDKVQGISVPTVPNTEYDYKVEITKNTIKCYLDGELKGQQLSLSFDMSLINNIIGTIGTGIRKGTTPTAMKIYLPDFSITVDGKEVFNGNKTGIDTIKADNYEVVGSPVISNDGVASGFSVANYIKSNTALAFTAGQTWEINLKVNIKNSESGIDKAQCLFQIYASNPSLNSLQAILYNNCVFWTCPTTPSGGATNRFLQFTSEFNISSYLNQDIWFKFIYNGTQYIFEWSADGINFTREVASTDSRQFTGTGTLNLGAMSIHQQGLQGSIDLNDTKVYINDNLVYQPCLKIPYTQSKTGSKIVDGGYRDRVQDVYEQFGTASYYTHDETNKNFTLPMGEIYGMIEQKADADMLNNPFTFGMNQYYKGEMKNLSWLKSYGQEYFKNGHPDFYNWVLTNANAGKEGFKLSTATNITDYDFVVNPTKETFMLPLKNGMEGVFASGVKGNGKSLGFTTGSKDFGLMETANQAVNNVFANRGAFNVPVGKFTPTAWDGEIDQALGVTTDTTKSGIVVDTTVPEGWNLYYYVGETVEGANLIKAGEVWEEISNKQDKCIHIIDTYVNGTSGYRVWSDGYCEQWGIVTMPKSAGVDVTLLKTLKDANYAVMATSARSYLGSAMGIGYDPSLSTVSKVRLVGFGISNNSPVCYVIKGYIA